MKFQRLKNTNFYIKYKFYLTRQNFIVAYIFNKKVKKKLKYERQKMNIAITGATSGIGEQALKNILNDFKQIFILARNEKKANDIIQEFSKEDQKGMMEYGLNIFRDLLMWKSGAESLVRLEGDELTFVQNFSKAVNLRALELISGEFSQTHYYLERNARAKILHLDLSLLIAKLFKQK